MRRWNQFIVHFDAYLETVPSDSEAVFYSGIAHLAAGKTADAIKLLSSVQSDGFIYALRAKWYLALAYMETDKTAEAKRMLEELKGSDFGLKEKFNKLLEEIDESEN